MATLETEIDCALAEFDRLGAELRRSIASEAAKIDESMRRIQDQARRKSVEGFSLLSFGAVWVMLGTVLSAVAQEIARLVAGQYLAVWLAL